MMDFFEKIKKKRVDEQNKDFIDFMNRRNDYIKTFGSEHGRRVLLDQMRTANIFSSLFTGNSETYLLEGERKRVLDIMMHMPQISGEVIWTYCKELESTIDQHALEIRKELDERQ